MESNEQIHVEKFQRIISEIKESKILKGIDYELAYSNFTFELWMILHKKTCNGSFADRSQYLEPINQAYGEEFEDLAHYKREDNFKRCLSKLSLDDVKAATDRAQSIANRNKTEGKKLITYMGYSYYKDNPALSIHESIQKMLVDCGIIKNPKSSRRKKNNT